MDDLFTSQEQEELLRNAPLAVRMRPRSLDEFVGQRHFIGEGRLLRRMIEADKLTSLVFYGPPGTGKTSLAKIIANMTSAEFVHMNATSTTVKEIREVLNLARKRLLNSGKKTVLFIDEIHRFNRAQQDVLLSDVEEGTVILIGATTENPFFAINSPLISRSQIFRFEPLSDEDIRDLIMRAIGDKDRGFGRYNIKITDEAIEHFIKMADGDARRALTGLEVAVLSQFERERVRRVSESNGAAADSSAAVDEVSAAGKEHVHHTQAARRTGPVKDTLSSGDASDSIDTSDGNLDRISIVIDLDVAKESIQEKGLVYDRLGDQHYDHASAFIKSMRGSDPDAAVYWLARMLASGEDIRFIARRIAICAAEDVGMADPMALVVANAAVQITEFVGMPEAQLILSEAAIYVASAPKSNASAMAIWQAMDDVKNDKVIPVPLHLRDANYKAAKEVFGHGREYKYDHSFPEGIAPQDYLGVPKQYYRPSNRGYELKVKEYLDKVRELRARYYKIGREKEGDYQSKG